MTWDVPTDQDCPVCGKTMFKRSGKGRMKPFCINEACSNFLPEDKRGYYKKPQSDEAGTKDQGLGTREQEAAKKTTAKKTTAKKPAAKKTAAKKPAAKKTAKKETEA
jgi:DNA topoisomerase-1